MSFASPFLAAGALSAILHPLETVSISNAVLGELVASLSPEGSRITDALHKRPYPGCPAMHPLPVE